MLASRNMDMLQGTLLLEELWNALLTTGLMIASALVAAVVLFNKTAL